MSQPKNEAVVGSPSWPATAAIGLFASRYFLPTEDAAGGGTILVAAGWLTLAAILCWQVWRRGVIGRFTLVDAAIIAFTLPQAIAGMLTLSRPADHRAAVNLTWEWLSLGVSLLVLRSVVNSSAQRRRFAAVILGATAAITVHGLYQHYVWYPSIAARFTEFEELERTRSDPQRLQQLANELGPEVTGRAPEERAGLRQRIVSSTEPLGFFALANTLGGVLACGLCLAACATAASLVRWTLLATGGWCLLLTKSRAAFVGLVAGAGVTVVTSRRRPPRWLLVSAAVLAIVAVSTLAITGGLDPEVITEAPKSLQYRMEYWSGAAGVVKDSPLLGAGLGNFRSAYLGHKLPGASEEVLDPHNWLLEAWAGGGLLGFLGAIAAVSIGLWRLLRVQVSTELPERLEGRVLTPMAVTAAIVLPMTGFPIIIDTEIICGLFIAAVAAALGAWQWSHSAMRSACLAASVTLAVHLLATGGFGMPAVTQLWLAAMFILPADSDEGWMKPIPSSFAISSAGVLAVLTVCCVLTAVLPSMRRSSLMNEAMYSMNDPARAEELLLAAAEADRLSAEPLVPLAGIQLSAGRHDAATQTAMEVIRRRPSSPTLRIWQGDLLRETGDLEAAQQAYMLAAEGYPNGASVLAALAINSADLKIGAGKFAAKAISLDDLNREAGHTDKLLPDDVRDRLLKIPGATE